ncbi:hypothetical protein [Okeania sp. KiyG1]|uniref:hypothetical protein n=1 Tax=Okeania sp. KiyG1 TaxID=2720165 RepID=UPI0019207A1B|nr:hypothetical protein [Okeania sp. KiyG1]GGA15321.1 hypothetical protein CYANOKiyG1_29240 [Okeania sp. KiyG1]
MLTPMTIVEPKLAEASPAPELTLPKSEYIWMSASGILLLLLVIMSIFHQVKMKQFNKKLNLEEFRNKDLQKKYKLAVATISKMEKNPDLIHSRDFNLDYLRMRMAEEVFHFAIVNQIKVKVKQQISVALRPTPLTAGEKGSPSGRQIDSMFDVEYETGEAGKEVKKRVLFRVSIKLTKLPTQATSQTINQIIDCLETYLSPSDDHDNWTPTIQGRIVHIDWDQKAKPTPMLVLEQSNDGVLFRTNRPAVRNASPPPPPPPSKSTVGKRKTTKKVATQLSTKEKTKGAIKNNAKNAKIRK